MVKKVETDACKYRREFLKSLMHEIMDIAGGADKVAKGAHLKFQRQPMLIAIEIMGGVIGTAEVLGMTRQGVDKLLFKDVGDWPAHYLEAIEIATRIPMQTLLLDKGPVRHGKVRKPVKNGSGGSHE